MSSTDPTLPLTGLRILDLTHLNGELGGRILGDFGADVIRVEPTHGAPSRSMAPLTPGGDSTWFAWRNHNKRGITLDLETADGLAELHRLLPGVDVVIESGKPAAVAALGLDPETTAERWPHLIVCSITDFGQVGPYADHKATPETLFALSGWLTLSGSPDRPPLLIPGPLAWDLAGIYGCWAIMCALLKRRRSGRGQHLDVSAFAALTQCDSWQLPNMQHGLNNGNPINQKRQGAGMLYPAFATADGSVRLVVLSAKQWDALYEWMGEPEEFSDPSWREIVTRYMNADVLNLAWTNFFADREMVPTGKEGQERGVVVAPMLKTSDVLVSEHLASRGTFTDMAVGSATGRVIDGLMELNGRRAGVRMPAPRLGEHNAAVLGQPVSAISLPAGEADDDLPLAGLNVVDFGHGGVGVEASRMLAEYGADVIKVESRSKPDFIRVIMGGDITPSFATASRSKRSLGVNAATDEGRQVLHRLLAEADIAVENNSKGVMEKLGIDFATVHEINPKLTMASSQLMGSHGTNSDWIGYGPTIQAISGLSWLWNFDDGSPPPGSTHIHPDQMAGRIAAIAALVGVWDRDRTGVGLHAEMAQVETLMATMGDYFLAESIESGSVRPPGNDSTRGVPWGVFPCAGEDEWAVICVRSDEEWNALVITMGSPEWAIDERFATADGRRAHQGELSHALFAWTLARSPQQVTDACQAAGVAAAPMLNAFDHLSDPHLRATNFIRMVDQPGIGELAFDGPAIVGTDFPDVNIGPAPALCGDTEEIALALGYTAAEIADLVERGILEIREEPATPE